MSESRRIAKPAITLAAAGLLAIFTPIAINHALAAESNHLQTVLAQMDAGSKNFRSAEADIQKQQFEKIVNDTTTETGKVYFLRVGNSMQFGGKFNPPSSQTVEYKNGVVRLYNANTNQVQQYASSGANQSRFETFLALGFGGSGAELAKSWNITDQGAEQMSDGGKQITVEKLDLVPKDPAAKQNFTHITIWVDPVRDVSLKQVFYAPSGDTQTAIYSNIKYNQKINLGAYAIKCSGKCGS